MHCIGIGYLRSSVLNFCIIGEIIWLDQIQSDLVKEKYMMLMDEDVEYNLQKY